MKGKLQGCHPDLVRKVQAIIRDLAGHGITAVVVEGRRSQARQDALYEQGRTTPGEIVTRVRHSQHTLGRAADFWFRVNGRTTCDVPAHWWDVLGSSARAHGLTWGGDWEKPDRPHVELP
jgi:peptidoglycan LD-endopeptidase CwlK